MYSLPYTGFGALMLAAVAGIVTATGAALRFITRRK